MKQDINNNLIKAVYSGNIILVKRFLNVKGCNPSYKNNAAIKIATKKGFIDIAKMLLNHKCEKLQNMANPADGKLDYEKESEKSALVIASDTNNLELLKLFLENGNIDKYPYNKEELSYIIRTAAADGHIKTLKYLIKLNDPRVNSASEDNYAIFRAIDEAKEDIIKTLAYDMRVKLGKFDEHHDSSPISYSFFYASDNITKYLLLALKEKSKYSFEQRYSRDTFSALDDKENNLLQIAIEDEKDINILKILLSFKLNGKPVFNLNHTNENGENVLMTAAKKGSFEAAKYIIDYIKLNKLSFNILTESQDNRNVLDLAAESGNLKLVKYIANLKDNKNKNIFDIDYIHDALKFSLIMQNNDISIYLYDLLHKEIESEENCKANSTNRIKKSKKISSNKKMLEKFKKYILNNKDVLSFVLQNAKYTNNKLELKIKENLAKAKKLKEIRDDIIDDYDSRELLFNRSSWVEYLASKFNSLMKGYDFTEINYKNNKNDNKKFKVVNPKLKTEMFDIARKKILPFLADKNTPINIDKNTGKNNNDVDRIFNIVKKRY